MYSVKVKSLLKVIPNIILKQYKTNKYYSVICKTEHSYKKKSIRIPKYSFHINYFSNIELDYEYLCDASNLDHIKTNILHRNCDGDIEKVVSLWSSLNTDNLSSEERTTIEKTLKQEALKIPNRFSSHILKYRDEPHILEIWNEKPSFKFKPKEFHPLLEQLNFFNRNRHIALAAGPRSYIFEATLANLQRALIRYTVSILLKKGFTLISVPDLLYSHIIEGCGMQTKTVPSQVYHIDSFKDEDVCLSGTAEMALAGYLKNTVLDIKEMPLKLAAVSRCYREEIGEDSKERGIYRVSEFTKVEMFGVTANETTEESIQLYQDLIDIQMEIYKPLGFHFKVLDMPLNELGKPAYSKTDIEAWIPVRRHYGEISSASVCLDYQSRRLNLKYKNKAGDLKFAHTVNGTACAVPRLLMTTLASNQRPDGTMAIPEVLQPFIGGLKVVERIKGTPQFNHFNSKEYAGTILKVEDLEGN